MLQIVGNINILKLECLKCSIFSITLETPFVSLFTHYFFANVPIGRSDSVLNFMADIIIGAVSGS